VTRPQRTEVDGVPTWWVDAPVPFTAMLMFRVGRADETLTTGGLTHFVEHLALSAIGQRPYRYNGYVNHNRTVFWATGRTPDDVTDFLAIVCRSLASVPTDRLEIERRVLRTEAGGRPASTHSGVWMRRFGATTYGLLDHPQCGLTWLEAADVTAWAAERFTRGNAVLCASGPIPPGLKLALPEGKRFAPLAPRGRTETPAYYVQGTSLVATTMLSGRSSEAYLSAAVLGRRAVARLRREMGASYMVTNEYIPLTADCAYLLLSADGAKDHGTEIAAALATTFDELLRGGPSEDELAELRQLQLRNLDEPLAAPMWAKRAAAEELLGAPHQTTEDLRAEMTSVARDGARVALGEAAATALLAIPEGTRPPDGRFASRMPAPVFTTVAGHEFELYSLERTDHTILGDHGISHTTGTNVVTVCWDRCVGVFVNRGGVHEMFDETGWWIRVSPWKYVNGKALIDALHAHLPAKLFVRTDEDPDSWLALWATCDQQPGTRAASWRELLELSALLEPEERISVLARATFEAQEGLLAAGNRRVLHVARGRPNERRTVWWPYDKITKLDWRDGWLGLGPGRLSLGGAGTGEAVFTRIEPRERAKALLEVVRRELQRSARQPKS